MRIPRLAFVAGWLIAAPIVALGQVDLAHFQKIGNERETISDSRTGREVVFLSQPDHVETLFYPTCRSWTKDSRYVLFESNRPRPNGQGNSKEHQLLMADAATGSLYWLGVIPYEDPAPYGSAHTRDTPYYHLDYAPGTDSIVYHDISGHNLYLLSLVTGKTELLLHMADGTILPPPSISPAGDRVIFYAAHPGPPEDEHYLGWTYKIYGLDVDTKTNNAKGKPFVITSYKAIKGPTYATNHRDNVTLGHCQINPANADQISYCHEYGGSVPDGSIDKARIWVCNIDGSDNHPVVRTPPIRWQTHEVWGAGGEWMYFADYFDVSRVNVLTGCYDHFGWQLWPRASHVDVAPDESFVVIDTHDDYGQDAHGENWIGTVRVDVASGVTAPLAIQPGGGDHPRHTHPNISPDGKWVAFTVAVGAENARVAYVSTAK